MREILSIIAVPLSGVITYVLGYLARKRKENAKSEALELENYQKVVDFYKNTFIDLRKEISDLRKDLVKSHEDNMKLKNEVERLNKKLDFLK